MLMWNDIMLIHTTNIISLLLLRGWKLPKQMPRILKNSHTLTIMMPTNAMGNSSLPAQLCYLRVYDFYMAAPDTAGHSPSANTSESHWWSHRLITLSFSIHTHTQVRYTNSWLRTAVVVLSVDFLLGVS